MSKNLDGKVAVITGARSPRGMGYAAAQKLAEQGADIVMTSRFRGVEGHPAEFKDDERFQAFQQLAGEIEQLDVRCLALPMDVINREQVNTVADYATETLGGIDILFNNAGIGRT